jgi:hypothetical protein
MKKIVKANKENQKTGDDFEAPSKEKQKFNKNKSEIKFVPNNGNKRRRNIDANTKNLRRLYNKLMLKDTKNEANKPDIVDKIIKLVGNNFAEFCYKHDGCRILQGSIKYGSKKQKQELIKNLKPFMYDLVNKKYSIFLAIKIFKFAENKEKEDIIKSCLIPNFNKLLKLSNGQTFLNYAFTNSPNNLKKKLVDHYINKIAKLTKDDIAALASTENTIKVDPADPSNDAFIVEKQGTYQQENVKDQLKLHLEKQLEKGVHKVYIFQAFLNQIFDNIDPKTKVYISELFDDDINEFLSDRHGVELACKLFNVSQAKTRKKTVKKLKDNISSILSNEMSILFLIKIILFCDDTKLVQKYILQTLIERMQEEFMQNKGLLKIFMNIIVPFNPHCNKQDEQKVLHDSADTASKKDLSKRRDELVGYILTDLLNNVNLNMKFFINDPDYSHLVVDIIRYLDERGEDVKSHLETILTNISELIKIDLKSFHDEVESTILANKTGHFTINKIITVFLKKGNLEEPRLKFIKDLANAFLIDLKAFLDTKAIFIIVKIMENPETKKFLQNEMKKYKTEITEKSKQEGLIGYQLLAKNLS